MTGACGWTATPIVEAVAEAGHEVYGFDLPDVPCNACTRARLSILARGTVESAHDVDCAVRSVDAIVHLAVAGGVDDYQSPRTPFTVNVLGTYNIFEAARRSQVSKIVLMSEAAVHLLPHDHTLDAREEWRSAPDDDHLY
ncbi:MAG: NAD(P)-dependent oxidoreductase, partial [Chloroflexota bacterium]|nr:NAD(P)-dependent oxidoreductase [Chloroflexota bacterium]